MLQSGKLGISILYANTFYVGLLRCLNALHYSLHIIFRKIPNILVNNPWSLIIIYRVANRNLKEAKLLKLILHLFEFNITQIQDLAIEIYVLAMTGSMTLFCLFVILKIKLI